MLIGYTVPDVFDQNYLFFRAKLLNFFFNFRHNNLFSITKVREIYRPARTLASNPKPLNPKPQTYNLQPATRNLTKINSPSSPSFSALYKPPCKIMAEKVCK